MSSLQRLYRLLAPLGIYALGQGSRIDHELEAYAAALALVEEGVERLRKDALPQTADREALSLHEGAAGLPDREGLAGAEERRELLLRRWKALPLATPAGALALLERAGLQDPYIEERGGVLTLSAQTVAPGLEDAFWQLALESLPAHLEAEMSAQGCDWNALEAEALTWTELDGLGRSWNALTLHGTASI